MSAWSTFLLKWAGHTGDTTLWVLFFIFFIISILLRVIKKHIRNKKEENKQKESLQKWLNEYNKIMNNVFNKTDWEPGNHRNLKADDFIKKQ